MLFWKQFYIFIHFDNKYIWNIIPNVYLKQNNCGAPLKSFVTQPEVWKRKRPTCTHLASSCTRSLDDVVRTAISNCRHKVGWWPRDALTDCFVKKEFTTKYINRLKDGWRVHCVAILFIIFNFFPGNLLKTFKQL